MKKLNIDDQYQDATLNIALDTININKQALIFVNSKRAAESQAEKIAVKVKGINLIELSEKIRTVLSRPTKQCERLARCVKHGIAFHHAGLSSKQRELIEDNFRNGNIRIICSTPTLCLSKDTMIWHDIQETQVSKLKNPKSLFVLCKDRLDVMKPQKIQKIKNFSKLIQITSVSGHSIKVTPNHKMLIKRNNKKLIINTQYINKTDKIATIGYLPIKRTSKPKLSDFVKDNVYECENYYFDNKLSYFIGAMLGDGYSGAENLSSRIKYKGSPMIVGIDKEIFDIVQDVAKSLNISTRKTKSHGNTPQLVLGKNKWFREFLVRCGVEQKEHKYISDKLMKMSHDNVSWILKGLFDTDGWVQKDHDVGFSNISFKLITQIQKLLLRFGIVTRIRKRKKGLMKIFDKEYQTKPSYELVITQKKSIFDFYRYIGFNLTRKQNDLIDLIAKISSNLNYVECTKCNYKIYKDLFLGRTKFQKEWGKNKLKVIKTLGEKGELASRVLKKQVGFEPKKKDSKLNHHYEFIKKKRFGKSEWLWSLNDIGKWYYENIIKTNKSTLEFFQKQNCPLCNNNLEWIIKKGWRDLDFDGDIFWDVIRNIKEVNAEEDVYDLVLPNKPKNDHMFVANGFVVHNSAGLDMPAFRTIIRDLKRYGGRFGMDWIQVLEYHQMAGRAGRPGHEDYGEAICIAQTEEEKNLIIDKFINGKPEEIYSKLAVEPVLRTYVLSLIATGFVRTRKELVDFFSRTFWAHQYQDMDKLEFIIDKMIGLLTEWEFLAGDAGFRPASVDDKLEATKLGTRVAQLYIDPLTANFIITCLRRATSKVTREFSYVHMICSTLEMRPIFRAGMKDYELIENVIAEHEDEFITFVPTMYDMDYEEFQNSVKTTIVMIDWIEEMDEHDILEKYNVRPGELRAKLDNAEWLLNATIEFARLIGFLDLVKHIKKTQVRLKNGVREELLPLLRLTNIGRVRARLMFRNGIKDLGDVKTVDALKLAQLIGPKLAQDVKKQVGQDIEKIKVKPNKRKGQMSLGDY